MAKSRYATISTLPNLPTEVVQQIAVHLTIDSCLSLVQTCSALRTATLDVPVLRAVIRSHHTLWNFHSLNLIRIAQRLNYDAKILQKYQYFALDHSRVGQWDKVAFNKAIDAHFGSDLDVWARYAVADLRAWRLCEQLNSRVDEEGKGVYGFPSQTCFNKSMKYLPHILTLKHPAIHASGLAPALATEVVRCAESSNEQIANTVSNRLAFAYCATMLSQDSPEAPLCGASNARAARNAFFTNRCREFAKRMKAVASAPAPSLSETRRQNTSMTQAEAMVIIGAFSSLLRHAFREYRVNRMLGSDYYTFILPFALDVPMDHGVAGMHPPLPFINDQDPAERSWEDWHSDQTTTMCSYDFLRKGTWVGCYSYTYPNVPEIDAPMMDIAFSFTSGQSITPASESTPTATVDPRLATATSVSATGKDSIGSFTLDGHIERNGHVSLQKIYEHGKVWNWNCQMTPFGIGGVWGPPESEVVNGSVWLWKREWTEGRES